MDFIKQLFPHINNLKDIDSDNIRNIADLRKYMSQYEEKRNKKNEENKCFICKKHNKDLKLRQCGTMKRVTDELIETHFVCNTCVSV